MSSECGGCKEVLGEVWESVGRGMGKCVGVWGSEEVLAEMWKTVLGCEGRWGWGKVLGEV